MKYNKKYDRWVSKNGLLFKLNPYSGKLEYCNIKPKKDNAYCCATCHGKTYYVHRIIWETFNGEIPEGMEIDHIDTNRSNNAISNLRLTTHRQNCNNKQTLVNKSVSMRGNQYGLGKIKSEFGTLFYEHYKINRKDDVNLYQRERHWYVKHNKVCRWEAQCK